ncbi:MAG: carboxypeptidase regulatory-like domain-containing protein [Myxococcales bacterium]|nr:carboxypeptidase regulatory-like domain-containing protein [Myxococcales bacterium]
MALGAAAFVAGCEAVALPDDPPDVGVARYLDGGALPDALARRDAAGPEPDAAILDENGEICRTGRLASLLCSPSGGALVDAEVEVATRSCDGRPIVVEARTDARGGFHLDGLRAGPATVRIQSGRFTAQYDVEIVAGTQVSLSPTGSSKVCLEPDAARLAVLRGDYDRIEGVLDDLGFAYDFYCGDSGDHRPARRLLSDPVRLASYEVLFVNCASGIDLRATNPEVERMRENVRAFVEGGGALYVSDLAADFVASIWPGAARFRMETRQPALAPACCVCTDDCPADCASAPVEPPGPYCAEEGTAALPACGAGVRGGGARGELVAAVVDDRLRALYGSDTIDVRLDLPGWVEIDEVGAGTEVLVRAGDRPLMIAFSAGAGRVVYTSFHNGAQAADEIRALLSALVFEL